jgi:(R,R)-butanediol dehydrogenase/meso-butanediol dehydrogenase/diacetyl reductase
MSLGADAFISGKHEDPARAVNEALGGVPDVIFECSGAPGTIAEAINFIRPRGTIVVVGFCTAPDTVYPAAALFKEIVVRFSMMYNTRDYEVVADVLGRGIVDPSVMITSTVGLDQLPAKFEALRGPNEDCKVIVDPWL